MEWLPASVPGHVHQDLVARGVIADPFEKMHELGSQWIDEEDWIYRTHFEVSPNPALPRRLLRFEGLDTVCRVVVDGELRTEHDNMFVPLEVDVSDLSRGLHELRIEFESAPRVGRARRAAYFAQEGLADHTVRFMERAFVRKAQYMFGWDWGPRLASAGIWRPAALVEFAGRLLDVHVLQDHLADGTVELTIESEHEGRGEALHYVPGIKEPVSDGQTVHLTEPRRWWPAGLGAQALYSITTVLLNDATPLPTLAVAISAALDVRTTRVGLRTVTLRREPDRFGESFEVVVNGKAIWTVGANWIPDHSMPALVSRARLEAQLRRALDMNMNMLRIWGGGLYETDEFYDLCDELGLLVWQDFPYACCYYPDGLEAMQIAEVEATSNVRRLRNRASLAIWCGNNENLVMFENGWEGRENGPPRYYGENIYNRALPEVLGRLDPERPYVPSSPAGGDSANDDSAGDQHYWDVWHGRGDWVHYVDSKPRFSSEFGFACSPGAETWKLVAPNALELPTDHALARWHDKTMKGYDAFLGYVELHYPKSENLEEWTYYSQLNQRDALRFGIEHYRRSDYCKGALIWQLNDCWPVQSWSVVDFAGAYKAAAYELRRLYAPCLASLVVEKDRAAIWTVLDNATDPVAGTAILEAISLFSGRTLEHWTSDVCVEPGQRLVALDADVGRFSRDETLLLATFAGTTTFRLLGEPKHARTAPPKVSVARVGGGLKVRAHSTLVDLYLWDADGHARFADNFVTLRQGSSVTLPVEGELGHLRARAIGGECLIVA
jgi:beta-mannosidase